MKVKGEVKTGVVRCFDENSSRGSLESKRFGLSVRDRGVTRDSRVVVDCTD